MKVQFCYAWDKNADNDALRYKKIKAFKTVIETKTQNEINVYFDKDNYIPNEKIDEELQRIGDMDLVCIFMTPDAKSILEEKIDNYKKRRLWQEWEYIKETFDEYERERFVFPIILEGDVETSLIDEFKKREVPFYDSFDLDYFVNGEKKQSSEGKRMLAKICKAIRADAHINRLTNPKDFTNTRNLVRKLFHLDDSVLPQKIVVKQDLVNDVMSQKNVLLQDGKDRESQLSLNR